MDKKEKRANYYLHNKEKAVAQGSAWYRANKEKTLARSRLRLTGVTQEQYDEAHLKQKGVCSICSCVCSTGKKLSADHCHTTGVFRGLLCGKCNKGLGLFNDNLTFMGKAMTYLKTNGCC